MSIRRASTSYLHSLDNTNSFGAQKRKYSNVAAGLGTAIFFTSNSSYIRPTNVSYIDLLLVGGGGGGGQNNYGGGGAGGNIYYIKKLYIGDATTYYCWVGRGGRPGGTTGYNWGQAPGEGDIGEPSRFTTTDYSTCSWGAWASVGDARAINSIGGGGGGANGQFGFLGGPGGGSGSNAGFGTSGRLSGSETWNAGYGFNGGAGSAGGGAGGGSSTSQGGNASGNTGGNGADGPDLLAPLPATFVNSASNTITTRFGGGGGGAGASVNGTGGIGGGGNGGSVGTPNTGGGGGGGAEGGSGLIVIWEHRN